MKLGQGVDPLLAIDDLEALADKFSRFVPNMVKGIWLPRLTCTETGNLA